MTARTRRVTLYGTLTGDIWMPNVTAQQRITVDLGRESERYVACDGSGLVDAIRAAVDGAGDFRSARLTADSFVVIEHRRLGPPDGTIRSWTRCVNVTNLPSLADFVSADTVSDWGDEE